MSRVVGLGRTTEAQRTQGQREPPTLARGGQDSRKSAQPALGQGELLGRLTQILVDNVLLPSSSSRGRHGCEDRRNHRGADGLIGRERAGLLRPRTSQDQRGGRAAGTRGPADRKAPGPPRPSGQHGSPIAAVLARNQRAPATRAELLQRTFAPDVLTCPSCQGRMRLIAVVTNPVGIVRHRAAVGS